MNIFGTHLYYPYIHVPERALIHSLLFQDGLQRIIPSFMTNREDDIFDAFCRDNLGKPFVENGDFFQATDVISDSFCSFLDLAHRAKKTDVFEVLLGRDYQNRLRIDKGSSELNQSIVFAEKMSPEIIEKLTSLGWAKLSSGTSKYPLTCEMREELCLLFMAVLACAMSKLNNIPISTENQHSEDLVRTKEFQKFFENFLPHQPSTAILQNFCVTLLIGKSDDPTQPSLQDLLTVKEAVRIRGSLDEERIEFGKIVERLVTKAKACVDVTTFLKEETKDVIEMAEDYKRSVEMAAKVALDEQRRRDSRLLRGMWRTGFSLLFPIGEKIVTGQLTETGLMASLTSAAIGHLINKPDPIIPEPSATFRSDRQKAYLFMNRMWDQIEARS